MALQTSTSSLSYLLCKYHQGFFRYPNGNCVIFSNLKKKKKVIFNHHTYSYMVTIYFHCFLSFFQFNGGIVYVIVNLFLIDRKCRNYAL